MAAKPRQPEFSASRSASGSSDETASAAAVAANDSADRMLLTKNQVSWNDARDGIDFIREDLAREWLPIPG
jgi:hypothetical protein